MKTLLTIVALGAFPIVANAANQSERLKVGGVGKVIFVNCCNAPSNSLAAASGKIGNMLMIELEIRNGTWKFAEAQKCMDATGARAAVFIVDDTSLPMSLVAMEARWGVVNVAGLDAKGIEKETLRVATVVLGGATSKYPASSMRPVFSKEDLAKKAGDIVTFDSIMAISSCLPELGVEPYRLMTREDAIEEGLIPADADKKAK